MRPNFGLSPDLHSCEFLIEKTVTFVIALHVDLPRTTKLTGCR